ncbi:kinase-like domain-containing protein [Hyaloraphidium curvatum]|nr:kinase-like domain-containing protein [Hyaloraphidium curvatum]
MSSGNRFPGLGRRCCARDSERTPGFGRPFAVGATLVLLLLPRASRCASVVRVTCGRSHSAVLLDDGTLRAFGRNDVGQSAVPSWLPPIRQMSAGETHNLVLASNGSIYAWGSPAFGQLDVPVRGLEGAEIVSTSVSHSWVKLGGGRVVGFGSNANGETSLPPGVQDNVRQISASYYFSVALTNDGRVFAFGDNTHGQLNVPPGLSNVTQISAGYSHVLAIANGRIVCWGSNAAGECNVPELATGSVRQIKAATRASFVVLEGGGLRAWGAVSTDQLPTTVKEGAVQVGAGEYHLLALMNGTGRVAAVGFGNLAANEYGQLDVPTDISAGSFAVSTPTQSTSFPTGAIIGLAAGVVAVLGAVAAAIFLWRRRKRSAAVTGTLSEVEKQPLPPRGKAKTTMPKATSEETLAAGSEDWDNALVSGAPPIVHREPVAHCEPIALDSPAASNATMALETTEIIAAPMAPVSPQVANVPTNLPTAAPPQLRSRLQVSASDVFVDKSRKIGEGSYGVVYEGMLFGVSRVAVKVLKTSDIDHAAIKAFRKEVATWEGLVQRNVLPLMAYCEDPPMMVTDYLASGNLRVFMSAQGWNLGVGIKLLLDVATGMAYLHSRNVLHGDLKSLNILVDENRAVIADFGLSKIRRAVTLPSSTASGGPAGTPAFLAPELFEAGSLAPPADVYAFAMLCYEVCSGGKFPFDDIPNLVALVRSVVFDRSRPARPPKVPDSFWSLVERCWTHEPSQRPTFVEIAGQVRAM